MTAGEILAATRIDLVRLAELLPGVDPFAVPVRPAPRWLLWLWRPWVTAMATAGGIYVHPDRLATPATLGSLIVHELVHVGQWRRVGRVRFPLSYAWHYGRGLIAHRRARQAYGSIPWETEATSVAADILRRDE